MCWNYCSCRLAIFNIIVYTSASLDHTIWESVCTKATYANRVKTTQHMGIRETKDAKDSEQQMTVFYYTHKWAQLREDKNLDYACNGLVTHKTQYIPRKVPDDKSSLHYLGLPETFLGKKFVSHKTFLRTAWDLPGMIIGRSCEGNSVCDGYNTFLGSCHSVLRQPWETARKKPVMYNC